MTVSPNTIDGRIGGLKRLVCVSCGVVRYERDERDLDVDGWTRDARTGQIVCARAVCRRAARTRRRLGGR